MLVTFASTIAAAAAPLGLLARGGAAGWLGIAMLLVATSVQLVTAALPNATVATIETPYLRAQEPRRGFETVQVDRSPGLLVFPGVEDPHVGNDARIREAVRRRCSRCLLPCSLLHGGRA